MRTIYNFNHDWLFVKEFKDEYLKADADLKAFSSIELPHTFNDSDAANGLEFFRSQVVYRKTFDLSEVMLKHRVYIEFEAISLESDVYFNGVHLGHHAGGFSTIRYDLTDLAKQKDNLLVVVADNGYNDTVYPLMADFTFCGGIYRNVNLIIAHDIHFNLFDQGGPGVYVRQISVTDEKAVIEITSTIFAKEYEKDVRLKAEIFDEDGNLLDYCYKQTKVNDTVTVQLEVSNPHLWQGLEDPYLHDVVVSIESFNEVVDQIIIPTGLRYFSVDPKKGFFLNGKHMRLNGVSRHQDRIDKGWAISEEDMLEDALLIKEVGANSIRLAHYQHSQYFYDLCDRMGFVLWAEIPFISKASVEDQEGTNAISQIEELVKQVSNHSSVFFYGVQNEIQIAGNKDYIYDICAKLNARVKELDNTRLTTMANLMTVEPEDRYNFLTDIVGFNKYFGWYIGKAEDFKWIHEYHAANPNVAMGISEYGVEGIIEYHTSNPLCKDYTEEYHALTHEIIWDIFKDADFLWSTYLWNMFDFGANIRDEGGVKGRNNKGLITFDRQIKKDAFYMYKASWSDEPVLHICSKRFVNRHEDVTDIKVYTNLDKITLFVNGKEIETLENSYNRVVFKGVKLEKNTKIEVKSDCGIVDFARFELVDEPYEPYILPVKDKGGVAHNWFTMPDDLDNIDSTEEIVIDSAYYSSGDKIKVLLANDETRAVIDKILPGFTSNESTEMLMGMTFDNVKQLAGDQMPQILVDAMNRLLQKIKK